MKVIDLDKLKARDQINSVKQNFLENICREIAIMKKLNHKNMVKLIDVLSDADENKLYMIMEYLQQGTLFDKAKNGTLELSKIWNYFREIVLGLEYCHECVGIVHRDIKVENILIG